MTDESSTPARRVLLLFAHPALERSRVHRRLLAEARTMPGITVHDLYEAYPDFDVDVRREQALLAAHDVLVVQCPFYWYSTPALVKQWQDLVLEHGWAYGREGTALTGKCWLQIVSAGGGANAYTPGGRNRMSVAQLLAPLENTALLCRMQWLPPHVIHGTHAMTPTDIEAEAVRYRGLLASLVQGARQELQA
ncbi:MAG: NAD(P)H-dependent oxidoreductase [Gemmatimonas sp.]|jgi:glutathione-regulated potassium-efflux system ancillary protein KefG|uniref:glutathione-regulated potassium-efflux system oxidoreductase KefF n=1 Tax=Gemmatimonas sp. TaxID=1962908 RepID=UPI00391F1627|nr:NAD(P)H-dependent oxidoreductase [Gemmatimonadota bacterium]